MPGFQVKVDYDEVANTLYGLAFAFSGDYLLSGTALLTKGFVYNTADVWVSEEDCEAVTWTLVDNT